MLAAARTVFEDLGFLETRVENISQIAEVSYGTFYRYFDSKEDIFEELSTQLFQDMTLREPSEGGSDPASRMISSNRAFYAAYRRNAPLLAVVEQVSTFNPKFRRLRQEHRAQHIARSARTIARWQTKGLANPDIDALMAARAMAAMIDHTIYLWLVQGEDADEETLLRTLDQMCIGAIGLPTPETPEPNRNSTNVHFDACHPPSRKGPRT